MKIINNFRSKLTQRLLRSFLLLGVLPLILAILVPSYMQLQKGKQSAERFAVDLNLQAETELQLLASTMGERYSQIFEEQSRISQTQARLLQSQLLNLNPNTEMVSDWFVNPDNLINESNYLVSPPESEIGFLISPLANPDHEMLLRQNQIANISSNMAAIKNTNPLIRSIFYATEDQTIWLYPNWFWSNGKFLVGKDFDGDVTKRPYYGEVNHIIWSQPYIDIEPIITVAAPIWVDGEFYGMAGIDYSLTEMQYELSTKDIGENGYFFIIDDQSRLMVPSDQVYEFMIDKSRFSSTNELLNQNFFNALPKSIQSEFQKQSTSVKLTANQKFLVKINLNDQPTYFAFAPIENTSWDVVIVKPVKDVIKNATQLSNDMEGVINHFYFQLIIMGFGFLLVIIVGGGISLQWLVVPIQELAKSAQEVIRGNFSYRVSLPSRNETKNKDELSELMDVFNQMMDTLHKNQLTINNQKNTLEHALKKKEQEFDIVNQISLLTNQTTDLSKNLAKALEISIKATGMNDGLVLLSEENKQFSLVAFYSDSHQRSEINNLFYNCLDHGLIKQALQDRIILSNELNSNITFSYENSSCSVASWIIVPLIQKSREIGAFVLFSETKSNLLSEWLVFLQAIGTHISVLIENNQLQDRMRELYIVEERRKIARELHDSVTQSLFSMSLMIEGMKSSDSIKKGEINSFLEILNSHTENIQKEIRVLIQELRPINLDGENLDSAILAHVSSLSRSTNTIVNIDFKGDFGTIPTAVQQNINRIVQESFSNIARHSQATKVDVLLKAEPHNVCLIIDDNGIGFDTHYVARNVTSNLGLMSMRERAESLNGVLLIRSKPGCGSHIEVHIPIDLLSQD